MKRAAAALVLLLLAGCEAEPPAGVSIEEQPAPYESPAEVTAAPPTTAPAAAPAPPAPTRAPRPPVPSRKPSPRRTTRRPVPPPPPPPPAPAANCEASYPDLCIPPAPPDLDCKDVSARNFTVRGEDSHGFDGDNDGIGCES